MNYKKPQSTLVQGDVGIYPLTTADQVILAGGSRLEKDGKISADSAANSDRLGGKTLAQIMLNLYPVGSVYISADSTSPASLFGGTWESIGGQFLLGANDAYPAGSTGGESEVMLTTSHMPNHNHTATVKAGTTIGSSASSGTLAAAQSMSGYSYSSVTLSYAGASQPHNNMPPYLSVNMWKRVS